MKYKELRYEIRKKFKKDKLTSVRISSKLFDKLLERGVTPQKIIDGYVTKLLEKLE